MSIFVGGDTRVVIQGIMGGGGKFHTRQMVGYNTNVVAGTPSRKGDQGVDGASAYSTVKEAVDERDASVSIVSVPPAFADNAIFEVLDMDLGLMITITESVPTQDMAKVNKRLSETDTRLIGPSYSDIIAPDEAELDTLPDNIFEEDSVGLVSRSNMLICQVVSNLIRRGIGQTTVISIGGDLVIGTSFVNAFEAFGDDPSTHAVVMCGEIDGKDEEQAVRYTTESMDTPVAGLIASRTAPSDKHVGHTDAIVSRLDTDTAESKILALNDVNIPVDDAPNEVADHTESFL